MCYWVNLKFVSISLNTILVEKFTVEWHNCFPIFKLQGKISICKEFSFLCELQNEEEILSLFYITIVKSFPSFLPVVFVLFLLLYL